MVGATRVRGGAAAKVIIERLCISLPYIETFNPKVIKGFVPELRSRYMFFVFRDPYVLCIYVMNILCTFHISESGYGTPSHFFYGVYLCIKRTIFPGKKLKARIIRKNYVFNFFRSIFGIG